MFDNGNFENTDGWFGVHGSISAVDNTLNFSVTNPNAGARLQSRNNIPGFVPNHKYYLSYTVNSPKQTHTQAYVGNYFTKIVGLNANTDITYTIIAKPSANEEFGLYVDTSSFSVGDAIKFSKVILVDLTVVFGDGLEPTIERIENNIIPYCDGWFKEINILVPTVKDHVKKLSQLSKYVVAAKDSAQRNYANYVCDGVDDQVEINRAINSLPDAGGTIELLEGTYNISMAIRPKNNTRIIGKGKSTIIKVGNAVSAKIARTYAAGAKEILVEKIPGIVAGLEVSIFDDVHTGYGNGENNRIVSVTESGDNWVVRLLNGLKYDCLLDNNPYMFSSYNAIECYSMFDALGVANVTIENISIDGNKANQINGNYDDWQGGIHTGNSHNSVIKDCYIHDVIKCGIVDSHYIDGEYDGSENIRIVNNHIEGCGMNAIHCHGTKKSVISNNILKNGSQAALYVIYGEDNTIASNNIFDCAGFGIQLPYNVRTTVSGGSIRQTNSHGIAITGNETNASADNSIHNVAISNSRNNSNAISIIGGSNCVVNGCCITNTSADGINIGNCTHCIVSNNSIKNIGGNNGILANGGSCNTIVGNNISKTTWGDCIYNTSENSCIVGNIAKNTFAQKITSANDTTVVANNVTV